MATLDLLIIGAGPIGLACGIEAQKAGLTYQIIEKGCLVNSLYNYPSNMTFFSTSEKLEIGGVPFISNNAKPTRPEALEYYRRVCTSLKLNVKLYEKVESVIKEESVFKIKSSNGNYSAKAVVLALGFYDLPYLLNVPGEDLPKVKHYYDEPHPYFAQKIVVVGAANSAVECSTRNVAQRCGGDNGNPRTEHPRKRKILVEARYRKSDQRKFHPRIF
jgi:thioredoxin reductase (NADPH)